MSANADERATLNDHQLLAHHIAGCRGVDKVDAYHAPEHDGWLVEIRLAEGQQTVPADVCRAVAQAQAKGDIKGFDPGLTRSEWGWQTVVVR